MLQGRSRSHLMYFTLFNLHNVVISPIRRLLISTCDRMLYHNVFFNINHLKVTNKNILTQSSLGHWGTNKLPCPAKKPCLTCAASSLTGNRINMGASLHRAVVTLNIALHIAGQERPRAVSPTNWWKAPVAKNQRHARTYSTGTQLRFCR